MSPNLPPDALEIFRAACELPSEQRATFVLTACGADEVLRAHVLSMLAWDDAEEFATAAAGRPDDLLRTREDGRSAGSSCADPPREIGTYRVVRLIAEGGMGAVYEARQEHPERRVAIKVARASAAPATERGRRFALEVQLLARLRHPGIAQIIEAGTTQAEAGAQQFLVMEYVEGEPLTRYGAALRGTRERLELMVELCKAVAHAHAEGVVHRDLKPDNVLVEPGGAPKVLDFGIAKVESAGGFGAATLRTEAGRILGTLGYMAPEQLAGATVGIGPAADVYSLGVMLYELLTGRLPHDLEGASITRALAIVATTDAPRLSVVRPEFRGDIDALVAKALEKEPRHRYADAAALQRDLERHLRGEPVLARPAGPARRLAKWARRNPALATAVLGLFFVLAVAASLLFVKNREIGAALAANELLLDARQVRLAEADAERLWPARAALVAPLERWLAQHRQLIQRLPSYADELAALRGGAAVALGAAPRLADDELQRRHDEIAALVPDLERLRDGGLFAQVEARAALARDIERITVDERRADWDAAIARVADDPRFGDLALTPQVGLVPLGPDPDGGSGLEEFLHYETHGGALPPPGPGARSALGFDGAVPSPATGLVFVLVPGGTFFMGAQKDDPAGANYDDLAGPFEHMTLGEVPVAPFFLSKYEMTAGQWNRSPGAELRNPNRATSPVANVSWNECDAVLWRLGLVMPTEAQWEYAARGGAYRNQPRWRTGDAERSLEGNENVFEQVALERNPEWPTTGDVEEAKFEDEKKRLRFAKGQVGAAPVGSYTMNAFGLYDMGGNVTEWCSDTPTGPRSRSVRGGNFQRGSVWARPTARLVMPRSTELPELGLRPARAIERLASK